MDDWYVRQTPRRRLVVAFEELALRRLVVVNAAGEGAGMTRVVRFDRHVGRGSAGNVKVFGIFDRRGWEASLLLNAVHGLFSLLSARPDGLFTEWEGTSIRAQIDCDARVVISGNITAIRFSIWFGGSQPILTSDADLEALSYNDYALIGFEGTPNFDRIAKMENARIRAHNSEVDPRGVGLGLPALDTSRRGITSATGTNDRGAWLRDAILAAERGLLQHSSTTMRPLMPSVLRLGSYRPESSNLSRLNRPRIADLSAIGTFDIRGFEQCLDAVLLLPLEIRSRLLDPLNFVVLERIGRRIAIREDGTLGLVDSSGDHASAPLSEEIRLLVHLYLHVALQATTATVILVDEIDRWLSVRTIRMAARLLERLFENESRVEVYFSTRQSGALRRYEEDWIPGRPAKGGIVVEPKGGRLVSLRDAGPEFHREIVAKDQIGIFVEGVDELRFFQIMLSREIAQKVVFLHPTRNRSLSRELTENELAAAGGYTGVAAAVSHMRRSYLGKGGERYHGICDGDAASYFGATTSLLRAERALFEVQHPDASDVFFLKSHEIENLLFGEGAAFHSAVASAMLDSPHAEREGLLRGMRERFEAEVRMLYESALDAFAERHVQAVRLIRSSARCSVEIPCFGNRPRTRRHFADLVENLPMPKTAGELWPSMPSVNPHQLRICGGKELLKVIAPRVPYDGWKQSLYPAIYRKSFGLGFRGLMHRLLKS